MQVVDSITTSTPVQPPLALPIAGRSRVGVLLAVRSGKVRPVLLLWALGVPIPLLLIFFLIRGCSL